MNTKNSINIILDFDGTVVTHDFPRIGKDIGAVPVLKELIKQGHHLILFTMRSDVENPTSNHPEIIALPGNYLSEAVAWFESHDIPLYGIQTNPTQHTWTTSPKAYGHLTIDDSAIACPLKFDKNISDRPFVCWNTIELLLKERGILK